MNTLIHDTEQFREKLRLAVLITPYGPVKPYGSTEYISKKKKKKTKKKKKKNWSYLSLFFRYLIRFEPEQEVTVSFLY